MESVQPEKPALPVLAMRQTQQPRKHRAELLQTSGVRRYVGLQSTWATTQVVAQTFGETTQVVAQSAGETTQVVAQTVDPHTVAALT